jgi:hypothetical protein
MSNFIVRNVVGTGVFAIPTSDTELYDAAAALQAILNGVAGLRYETALVQIVDIEPNPEEMTFVADAFTYNGSWIPANLSAFRTAIMTALIAHPNIDGLGDFNMNLVEPKRLYTYVPQVDRVDNRNGIIYFKDEIPPGAQIEVYRYARKLHNSSHGPYTRVGKRWRPDQLLPVGGLQYDASDDLRSPSSGGRTHFRFAYRWPDPPPSNGPGQRGPLSAFTISTANNRERSQGCLLVIVASPSSYNNETS